MALARGLPWQQLGFTGRQSQAQEEYRHDGGAHPDRTRAAGWRDSREGDRRQAGGDQNDSTRGNRRDFDEMPDYPKPGITVHFVDTFDAVTALVF